MNDVELPPLTVALVLFAGGALALVFALRLLCWFVPARERIPARYSASEVLLVLAAPFVAVGLLTYLLSEPGALALLIANQLAFGAGAVLAVYFAGRHVHGVRSLGLGVRASGAAFLGSALAYGPLFVASLGLSAAWLRVCRAFGWAESQDVVRMLLDLRGSELALAAFIAVVIGPLVEELCFRGFLLAVLTQAVGERWALWGISALFAALHGVAGLPALFALSLFLGWLQQRTRCVLVPWLVHALNNGLMLALALAAQRG